MSLLGSMQTSVFWKAQAVGHPQQEKMQAGMTLMLTSVVELLQSLLEVVVLLSELAAQLVSKLKLSIWNREDVFMCCGGLCDL